MAIGGDVGSESEGRGTPGGPTGLQAGTDTGADRKEWAEYVSKLIDRHFRRSQTSGFTSWAVLGLLVVIAHRFIDAAPDLFASTVLAGLFWSLLSLAGSLSLVALALAMPLLRADDVRRLLGPTRKRYSGLFFVPAGVFVFVLMASHVVAAEAVGPRIPHYLLAVLWLLQVVGLCLYPGLAHRRVARQQKVADPPYVLPGPLDPIVRRVFFAIVAVLAVWGLASTCSAFPEQGMAVVKQVLEVLIAFLMLVLYGADLFRSRLVEWLQDLEYRIISQRLPPEDIRLAFETEYVGRTLVDWLAQARTTMHAKFALFEEAVTQLTAVAAKVGSTEQGNPPIESVASYLVAADQSGKQFMEFTDDLISRLLLIAQQGPLNAQERALVSKTTADWRRLAANARELLGRASESLQQSHVPVSAKSRNLGASQCSEYLECV